MARFSTTTTYEVHCPQCDGDRVIKVGIRNGQQRYECKACKRKFRANGKPKGRQMDAELMGAAIQDHYDGKSYKKITEAIEKEYDIPEPSKATVYEWVRDYSAEAIKEMKDHPAKTGGGNWVADEMHLEIRGKKAYLWDIMDRDTRYILASHLSYRRDGTRSQGDAPQGIGRIRRAAQDHHDGQVAGLHQTHQRPFTRDEAYSVARVGG